jgi:hypothetical protein
VIRNLLWHYVDSLQFLDVQLIEQLGWRLGRDPMDRFVVYERRRVSHQVLVRDGADLRTIFVRQDLERVNAEPNCTMDDVARILVAHEIRLMSEGT